MSSVGPNYPASVSTSGSGVDWTSTSNALANDSARTTATGNDTQTTKSLELTNFGFNIPSGATIDGIVIHVDVLMSSASSFVTVYVQPIRGGVTEGNIENILVESSGSPQNLEFGSSADLWNLTWNTTQINSSTTGVSLFAVFDTPKSATVQIDYVTITVHYTGGEGGGSSTVSWPGSLLGVW